MNRQTEIVKLQQLIEEKHIQAVSITDAGASGICISWNGDDEYFSDYDSAAAEINRVHA